MKWILRAAGALAVLIVLLVAIAFVLPRDVSVSRSIVVDAAPDKVWPHVSSLSATREWSPWMSLDPDMVVTLSGPEEGVGNRMDWVSDEPNVGTGSQEIVAATENVRVDTALDFGSMGTANATILLEPSGDSTLITWSFETDMGMNPMARWMGLMMDRWVGADYEKGLTNLKQLVEAG